MVLIDEIKPKDNRRMVTGLTPGRYYKVQVRAVNSRGTSPANDPLIIKTRDGKAVSLPLGLIITLDMALFYGLKKIDSSLIFHENVHCGYSLEVPW